MGVAENRAKNSKMAADLVKRGIHHGKRMTRPYPNSSGDTLTAGPGSSKFQRLVAKARGTR